MTLHPHTKLMNFVIGLCKGNKYWVSTLRDLHYNVEIIEKTLRTQKEGKLVKADIIKVSKKRNHALVIECKSGTGDNEQMERYKQLTKEDVLRWVDVPSDEQFSFDVCVVDFPDKHDHVSKSTNFPILTFESDQIKKTNHFSNAELEKEFNHPISLNGMVPPLEYYPFSDNDDDSEIIPRVLRTMVVLAMKRARGGQDVLDQTIFKTDEILQKIHPLWNALSDEHRSSLIEKISSIVDRLLDANKDLRIQLETIQRGGFKISGPVTSFSKICDKIIENSKSQTTLDSTLSP